MNLEPGRRGHKLFLSRQLNMATFHYTFKETAKAKALGDSKMQVEAEPVTLFLDLCTFHLKLFKRLNKVIVS